MRLNKHGFGIGKFHLSWVYIVGFCIFAFAAYLRFFNFPLKYGFDIDPTRDALITSFGATHFQFPLIGPKSGLGPFTFGPWYYYELILFKILFPVAYSPFILISLMSLGFVVVMYCIGKELEGKWFGILLATIAAVSPEQIGPTTGLSNPNLVPIHAALTVFFFVLYMKKKSLSPLLIALWGFLFGVGINHHYQIALLLPLPLLAFVYKRNKKALFDFVLFVVGIIISFIPLLIFNISHHFSTITGFIFYLTKGRQLHYIPNSWSIYIKEFWAGRFLPMTLGITPIWTLLVIVGTFFGFIIAGFRKKISVFYTMLLITFFIDFLFLRYFIVQRELYYFLFLHPFLFIFLGFALWQLKNIKYGLLAISFLFIAAFPSIWYQDMLRVGSRGDQIAASQEAKAIEKTFPGNTFALYGCNKSNLNTPQGIVFFLDSDKKLSTDGRIIILVDTNCTKATVTQNHISAVDVTTQAVTIDKSDLKRIEALGFWKQISPETVYHSSLEE